MKKDKLYILLDGVLFQLPRCRGPSVGLAHSWVWPPPPEVPGITEANDENSRKGISVNAMCQGVTTPQRDRRFRDDRQRPREIKGLARSSAGKCV